MYQRVWGVLGELLPLWAWLQGHTSGDIPKALVDTGGGKEVPWVMQICA